MQKIPLTARQLMLLMRLQEIQNLPIPDKAKDRFASIVKANTDNKQGEGLDFALNHLPKERLAIVSQTAKQIHTIGQVVTQRGRTQLSALSEAEWQALVDKANE